MNPPPTPTPTPTPLPLADLDVIVLDCQATAASPRLGHLLEIAWTTTNARAAAHLTPDSVHAHLVAQPEATPIPARITELTGITDADLDNAAPPAHVADALRALLPPPERATLTIIHYASFERPFLHALLGDDTARLDLVCTHALARHLVPDLPSRGIRAVAGYFGFPIERLKRSGEHVLATARIWEHFVGLLAERDVHTIDDLRALLQQKAPKPTGPKLFRMDREQRLALPSKPGVYRMLAHGGKLLYVGKATNLKARVNSYFQKRRADSAKNKELLAQVWDIAVTPTSTPLEAALLETDLIKAHAPPYNVALTVGHRAVLFASADLASVAERPDTEHTTGPLTSTWTTRFLPDLRHVLDSVNEPSDDDRLALMSMPERWLPDLDTFRLGLARFIDDAALAPHTPLSRLASAGRQAHARFLAQRLAAAEAAANTDDALDDDLQDPDPELAPNPDGFTWTPEAVAAHLDALLRGAALALRRARWLVRLSEAHLVWLPRGRRTQHRLLTIHAGHVADARDVADPRPPPLDALPFADRLPAFDLATVDRMMVLSGELRTLVRLGRPVQLALGPRALMDADDLRRLFLWL